MRRLVAAVVVMLAVLVSVSRPADAAPDENLSRQVSGEVTGTTFFDFSSHGCSFVYQSFDLTYVTSKGGTGTFHADTCGTTVDVGGTFVPTLDGTFVLETPNGAVVTGTLHGVIGAFPEPLELDIDLTVTSGTKSFRHATGAIDFIGGWLFDPPQVTGTFDASLTK